MYRQAESAKPVDGQWHEERQEARENAFSLLEFSDIDITRWDLDTADITGKDNPRTYRIDRPLNQTQGQMNNGTDIRTLEDR